MEESLKERLENELEVLQAIFMDDFRDLNDGNEVIWKLGKYHCGKYRFSSAGYFRNSSAFCL